MTQSYGNRTCKKDRIYSTFYELTFAYSSMQVSRCLQNLLLQGDQPVKYWTGDQIHS